MKIAFNVEIILQLLSHCTKNSFYNYISSLKHDLQLLSIQFLNSFLSLDN